MKLGAHVRTVKGLPSTVDRAVFLGCEAMQIFAANPSAWRTSPLKPDLVDQFLAKLDASGIDPVVIHTPYLINLASPDPDIYEKSIAALSDSMLRADTLHARYVVTHIGSHRGEGLQNGRARVREAVARVLDAHTGDTTLLLENSGGAGDSVGSKFIDLGTLLDDLDGYDEALGICLDTAHLWGAGYDLSNPEALDEVLDEFGRFILPTRLKLLHLNDTSVALESRRDRHANVGTGHIGEKGFSAILHHPLLTNLVGLIETPPRPPEAEERDLDILKRLREASE